MCQMSVSNVLRQKMSIPSRQIKQWGSMKREISRIWRRSGGVEVTGVVACLQ